MSLAFHAAFTSEVHTALHIADTSVGSADKSVSTKLSEPSNVPGCSTYLSKVLVNSTPSLLIAWYLHRFVYSDNFYLVIFY